MALERTHLVLAATLLLAVPGTSSGQTAQYQPIESAIMASSAVPDGELRGIVVDARSGEPLQDAHVSARNSGAVTDSAGLFAFKVPPEVETVTGAFINYFDVRLTLPRTASTGGLVARIALEPGNWQQPCEYLGQYGVSAEIRDATTGRPPVGEVTLSIRQDTLEASSSEVADPSDQWLYLDATIGGLSMGPRRGSDAPIAAQVRADAYATWRRSDIVIERDRCGHGMAVFRVFLLPVDSNSTEVPSNTIKKGRGKGAQ